MDELINEGISLSGVGAPRPSAEVNGGLMDTLERYASPLDASFAVTNAGGAALSFMKGNFVTGMFQAFQAGAGALSDIGPAALREMSSGIKNLLSGEGGLMDVISPVTNELKDKLDFAMNPPQEFPDLPKPNMTL